MSKWACAECKQSNNSHATYCIKCGHFKEGRVYKKTTVTWRCPICKEENNDSRNYCFKCGHWLLSEHSPSRIEEEQQKSYPKSAASNKKSPESKASKTAVVEIIVLVIMGLYIAVEEGSLQLAIPFIVIWILMIHMVFSVIYIAKTFFQQGIVESGKKLVKHGAILLGIFIMGAIATNIEPESNISSPQADSLTAVTSNALELQYEDMLRNANGKYKNAYVKISGEVYHLENGKQKNIMINVSTDPLNYQAVYVKRNEQDQTVIIKDNVVIYGKLSGTAGTINVLGVESAVPVIESYSLNLKNE